MAALRPSYKDQNKDPEMGGAVIPIHVKDEDVQKPEDAVQNWYCTITFKSGAIQIESQEAMSALYEMLKKGDAHAR